MIVDKLKFEWDKNRIETRLRSLLSTDKKGYICAVNANVLVHCFKSQSYTSIVTDAVFNVCDGINVKRINNIVYRDKVELLPGPDLFEFLTAITDLRQFYLGGSRYVLDGLYHSLLKIQPAIDRKCFYSPPFLPADEFAYPGMATLINKQKPDIIWVGLGTPKQEIFMRNILPYLDRGFLISVGAAFNFCSGIKGLERPWLLFRKLRLEWLYRVFQEPKRIIPRQIRCAYYLPQILLNELVK
jgi:N-acetylglucosaminyldiphosphoundecaprenol N-acetyl-beta-D-mannosaminyltransferase